MVEAGRFALNFSDGTLSLWMDSVVDRSPLDSESQSLSFWGGLEFAAAHIMCACQGNDTNCASMLVCKLGQLVSYQIMIDERRYIICAGARSRRPMK